MPSGAKKRKALKKKKKKELESTGSSTNNKGYDEHGSQDEIESDSNLSSPGSQVNGEFWSRDLSPSPLSAVGNVTVKEITAVDADLTRAKIKDIIAMDHEDQCMDNSFPEANGDTILEILPAEPMVSSVSEVVIFDKNERVESSAGSDSVQLKSDGNEEKKEEDNIPGSAAETSKEFKSVKESQVPECSEEKSLLPSGPPVVRTSWLSCCGLFDVMSGSER